MKLNDSIRESPREQVDEEIRVVSRTLLVEIDTERINSPPPRPQSKSTKANNSSDIKIPVPTPTPTPIDLGKDNNEIANTLNNKETDYLSKRNSYNEIYGEDGHKAAFETDAGDIKANSPEDDSHKLSKEVLSVESYADVCDCQQREDAEKLTKSNEERNDSLKKCQFMLDNMHSKMEDEDIIIDPVKMLQGEGEFLKNSEENGRDHYDEGFHSGELVASEEDNNSVEALGNSEIKDEEEYLKPIRASTPMPRSASFYKSPESKICQELWNAWAICSCLLVE